MAKPPTSTLARVERRAARIALWASLAATLVAALLLHRFAKPAPQAEFGLILQEQSRWHGVDFGALPEVQLLRELVAIDSSQPHPDEIAAAELIASRLAAAGIPSTIERFSDRRANLWAILEGRRPEAVVLHGHLDVEPLLDEGEWKHPPLGGEIDGPWIYGRGMYDMKSLTVAQLLAFLEVARSGRKPERSLILLATSSEEIGSDTGTRRILAERPELVRRFGTVLTEGGVVEAVNSGNIKYWGIEFAQKRFARIDFCSDRESELEALRDLLLATGFGDPVPDVDPNVRAFLRSYAPTRDLPLYRELLAEPDRLPREQDRFEQLSPFMKSLFRNEVVPFRLAAEPGGGHRLEVSVHLLPGSDLGPTLARLLPPWKTHGMTSNRPDERGARAGSPIGHADFRRIVAGIEREYPKVAVGPYFLPWTATDARYFRAVGIRAYGVSPFAVLASETTGIAKPDERMQLPAFVEGVGLYARLVRDLVE